MITEVLICIVISKVKSHKYPEPTSLLNVMTSVIWCAFPILTNYHGSKITLHLYQHVRENQLNYSDLQPRKNETIFLRLINVKGLGPKGALAILASSTPEELVKAIEAGNPRYFNAFPGIGQKISQQIILDLKGKLRFDDSQGPVSPRLADVESALKALGYKTTEIRAATKDLSLDDQTTTGELVKIALRRLSKN